MKKLVLFSCLLLAIAVQAQKEKGEAYINTYKEIAIAEMLRSGVPASITLAQGILESQYGESDLVKSSNNHFGIKCKTEWTGPKVYHDDDEKGECFRVYATPEESFRDHSDFLKTRAHYAFLFKLDPTDYDGWAKGLKKAGYATLPTYPQRLLKVINDYNLQQYSLEGLARLKNPPVTPVIESVAAVAKETVLKQEDTTSQPIAKSIETAVTVQAAVADSLVKNTAIEPGTVAKKNYPAGIFTINHTKVIYAMEGVSLLSLANQYDISLSKLIEFNDLAEMDVLDTDRLLFIEKKLKKGAGDFHVAATGESLHDICQVEGVRLENVLEYNKLLKNAVVKPGDKIYLHVIAAAPATAKAPK
jgi:LysM repeat protein